MITNPLEDNTSQCDHCEEHFLSRHVRRLLRIVNNSTIHYFLCAGCHDHLAESLKEDEHIECADCRKMVRWHDDKCDCL